jgi:PPIC-type PPIASE domain
MNNDLQQAIQPDRIVYYLGRSELLIPYLREVIIEETLATWEKSLSPHQLRANTATAEADDRSSTQIDQKSPEVLLPHNPDRRRADLLQQYKETEWGHLIISRFLAHKSQLDRVLFSTIQVSDFYLAQELYCRICEDGQSFARLAKINSQCPTAIAGGATGPILVSKLHPLVQYYITHLAPKQISPVFKLDPFYTFVRLDRWLPAQFTPQMRQQLLDLLFEEWLQQQIAARIGDIYATTLTPVPELPPDPAPTTAPTRSADPRPDLPDRVAPK